MAGTAGISEAQVQANSWETWDTRGEEILMLAWVILKNVFFKYRGSLNKSSREARRDDGWDDAIHCE